LKCKRETPAGTARAEDSAASGASEAAEVLVTVELNREELRSVVLCFFIKPLPTFFEKRQRYFFRYASALKKIEGKSRLIDC